MPSKDRERRTFAGLNIIKRELPADGENQPQEQYIVEGYASTFTPYTLYSFDGVEYQEKIDPHAFDETDMTDVKFLYNHDGHVYARTKGGTLKLNTDTRGLHVTADLGSTEASRQMYEEINAGLVDQMSFAFTVREDSYDIDNHMRTILKIDKLYDVSAVSEPANPDTDISPAVRDAFHGAMEAAQRAEGLAEQAERPVEEKPENRQAEKPAETNKSKITTRGEYKPMTYNEISYLNTKGLDSIVSKMEARKAELGDAVVTEENAKELRDIDAIIMMVNDRKKELAALEQRKADAISVASGAGTVRSEQHEESVIEKRARTLIETGKMEMRQLLSTDTLRPDAAKQEIGELPTVISSIVDDVHAFALDGVGAWGYAYRDTDSVATAVTEGSKIGGTAGTFKTGKIEPTTWGVLDEISNLVKKFSPLDYEASVRNNAYLALRRYAKREIVKAILKDGSLAETKTEKLTIDENALRTIVLGFNSDETVAGGAKMYLSKGTLIKFGQLRNDDKKPLYDITFTDENNGVMQEGGMAVNFSILSDLAAPHSEIDEIKEGATDIIIYGQPGAIDMPLWGNYTVETDEGGDYFQRNMMGIRGLQTAGVGVTKKAAIAVYNNVAGDP